MGGVTRAHHHPWTLAPSSPMASPIPPGETDRAQGSVQEARQLDADEIRDVLAIDSALLHVDQTTRARHQTESVRPVQGHTRANLVGLAVLLIQAVSKLDLAQAALELARREAAVVVVVERASSDVAVAVGRVVVE